MFLGFDGFKWFEGVVEDRFDPLELGRVRVRVYGIHTSQKVKSEQEGIPTEELLWMNVLTPITSARMSGIGETPLGPVEGTEVFGYFRDNMCQVGVIIGTLGGIEHKPDPSKGFNDPNGQYPKEEYYGQSDVNVLARNNSLTDSGEIVNNEPGESANVNVITDETTAVAVNPDDTPAGDYIADDDPNYTIEKMLINDEGIRNRVYKDSEGYPTVGIGHLIVARKTMDPSVINPILSKQVNREVNMSINNDEIRALFKSDLEKVQSGIIKNKTVGPVYAKLNRSRQMAIENMCFQMGVAGVAEFKNTLRAMSEERWQDAYRGLQDSLWAKQTPGRSQRVSKIVLTGNLESYGVIVKSEPEQKPAARKILARALAEPVAEEQSPEDPFTPEDTRIMFTEPKTSYAAQYPYNHVYESESGHIQEFDDTPGAERYRRIHPSTTYEEIRPEGGRTVRIVGDDFLIVQQGRNVNIKGNLKVVVEGDALIYNMGNVSQTIDGNVTEFIRGNVKQTVEGEMYSHIKQNAELIVEKDLTATVNQNLNASIKENATVNVGKKAEVTAENADVTVKENMNLKATTIDAQADTITMHGQALVSITGGTVQVG